MKKIKAMAITVSIAMILSTFVLGCKEPTDPTDPNKTEDSSGANDDKKNDGNKDAGNQDDGKKDDGKQDDPSKTPDDDNDDDDQDDKGPSGLQLQLDSAQAGGSVTLDKSKTGSSIEIKKKLTVNGNGIQNLAVVVNPDVADNVKLKNFVNATITIKESAAGRSARLARGAEPDPKKDPVKPREIGDNNPKLYIEDCSFEKIIAEDNISLFMEEDTLKSTIKEIELKNGIESFVVIEDEADDLEKAKKSSIDKITIEKGVSEVELLGGYYKEIEFKGEFTAEDKVDFYYDEKGDQVEAAFKEYLTKQTEKVAAKDICNVKNGKGIYKFTIPAAEVDNLNDGQIAIILMKDEQKNEFLKTNSDESFDFKWATLNTPYFEIAYSDYYKFETTDTNVHSICGVATISYIAETDTMDYLEFFNNYSKEEICSQKTSTGLDIYLDLSKVRKADLATCAFKEDGFTDEYYCQPRKLTEIDLQDYKPYVAIIPGTKSVEELKELYTFANQSPLTLPFSKSNNGSLGFRKALFTPMDTTNTYPDVSNVSLNKWPCADMLELYEVYDTGGNGLVHRLPLQKFQDVVMTGFEEDYPYDYYIDEACTQLFWAGLYENTMEKLYVKAVQTVNYVHWGNTDVYPRSVVWWMISQEQIKYGLFTMENPSLEDYNNDNSIKITDINQMIGGKTYYLCNDPTYNPYQ